MIKLWTRFSSLPSHVSSTGFRTEDLWWVGKSDYRNFKKKHKGNLYSIKIHISYTGKTNYGCQMCFIFQKNLYLSMLKIQIYLKIFRYWDLIKPQEAIFVCPLIFKPLYFEIVLPTNLWGIGSFSISYIIIEIGGDDPIKVKSFPLWANHLELEFDTLILLDTSSPSKENLRILLTFDNSLISLKLLKLQTQFSPFDFFATTVFCEEPL